MAVRVSRRERGDRLPIFSHNVRVFSSVRRRGRVIDHTDAERLLRVNEFTRECELFCLSKTDDLGKQFCPRLGDGQPDSRFGKSELAVSSATRKSQLRANSHPPPTAYPRTMPISGLFNRKVSLCTS